MINTGLVILIIAVIVFIIWLLGISTFMLSLMLFIIGGIWQYIEVKNENASNYEDEED